ncbi:MAG: hypothetical protein V3U68_03035 [Bacteroidota bacterium]
MDHHGACLQVALRAKPDRPAQSAERGLTVAFSEGRDLVAMESGRTWRDRAIGAMMG